MSQEGPLAKQLEDACLAVLNPINNHTIREASSFLNRSAKHINSIMPLHG
jgi:hypothetical protein